LLGKEVNIFLEYLLVQVYNLYMSNKKAPNEIGVSRGASLITAEAAMDADTFIIRLCAVNLNRRNHSDLPQLPNRLQTPRTRPQG
jgi:hypothetical protein